MFPLARHQEFGIPPKEVLRRAEGLQHRLAQDEIDLAWIDHPTDRLYYAGTIQDGVLLVPAGGDPVFHVRLSRRRAQAESPLTVEPFPGRRGLLEAVRSRVGARGRLGLPLEVTPASTYRWLTESLEGIELVDIGAGIRAQRAVKSGWEQAQVRGAARQAHELFADVARHLREGVTELELSAALEHRVRLLGHAGTIRVRRPGADLGMLYAVAGDGGLYPTNFDGPVGAEGVYPYTAPGGGRKPIRAGETVMVDLVTAFNGYHADHTRTFALHGDLPARAREAHAACEAVLAQIEARMRPGVACGALFTEVSSWLEEHGAPPAFMGYGDNQVKFLGHGVGLELDEWPILAARFDRTLEAGMVVAVEPKAFLEGIGPVGVENTYIITDEGCESLGAFPTPILEV